MPTVTAQYSRLSNVHLTRERGHAVRPHRFMAANKRPYDILRQLAELGPVGFRTRFRRSHHGILSSLTGLSRHTRWCMTRN